MPLEQTEEERGEGIKELVLAAAAAGVGALIVSGAESAGPETHVQASASSKVDPRLQALQDVASELLGPPADHPQAAGIGAMLGLTVFMVAKAVGRGTLSTTNPKSGI
ncbi:hypothetical protein IPG41_04125 [Candidatus Peregrinibacteria bacterium]|nr:MAG: hypothetical protein IPG41_04125 [Candidatus Peregrinibacteria bacterium]